MECVHSTKPQDTDFCMGWSVNSLNDGLLVECMENPIRMARVAVEWEVGSKPRAGEGRFVARLMTSI